MNTYKKINNYIGWSIFLIASFVYLSTIEQTVSFWDCGEYISTAYKLEVGHPPGAPFFQLFGRIFTLFAAQGTSEVAIAINVLSALCSSFTILFLFWTITAFGRKIYPNNQNNKELGKNIAIFGSGIVGALAYTFSDSFWFSAVEGEVYAMSSLFTAVTFWCIMKWEEEANKPHASKWLVLIAYLIGLSIGVHLLSLLTIPAMGMIYYYKKREEKKELDLYKLGEGTSLITSLFACFILLLVFAFNFEAVGLAKTGIFWTMSLFIIVAIFKFLKKTLTQGIDLMAIFAFLVSIIILGIVQGVVIPGAVSLISTFELFFVNTLGLPFNSGTILYFITIIGSITFGIIYTKKNHKPMWNTLILGVMMLLIGYSSFAILVVRSNANPPIDENNPEDAVGLLSYLKREQYGSWPIVYGQHFNASPIDYKEGSTKYTKGYQAKNGKKTKTFFDAKEANEFIKKNTDYSIRQKYIEIGKNSSPVYADKDKMLFPRLWSNTQPRHAQGYAIWANLKDQNGKPSFSENIRFFFKYQIGWSYIRYFMWNFAGRQNDFMNMDGNPINGNWESGISFIDNMRIGTPSKDVLSPNYLAKNKAKNHYYFLPLILGALGMLFHFKKNNQHALSVLLFFLFTGVLIIIYLNIVPFQPRERDYAYVGSFYAFSIWIGLGVLGIYDYLSKKLNSKNSAILSTIICLSIPTLMASENWDDHDRSGRFTALEIAKNYLNSCDKNAILFTNGDNDTFPLWYAQEVEGIRTDIKVVNLSLFNTDWYIDQMKRASYEAAPIPSSLKHEEYRTGTRDYTPIQERVNGYIETADVIQFIKSNNPKAMIKTSAGLRNYCPTRNLKLSVNKDIAKEFVPAEYHDNILDEIKFKLKGNGIFKNKLLVLDILANFNWERPIYFAITVGKDNFMGLEKYFQLEGLAYRLVPYSIQSSDGQTGIVNTEKMYDRLINKFNWGGLNNQDLYFDETNTRMVMNFRNNYSRLAEAYLQKNEKEKAIIVLDKCVSEFPNNVARLSYFAIPIIDLYYKLGENKKGNELLVNMIDENITELQYLKAFKNRRNLKQNIGLTNQILGNLARVIQIHQLEDSSAKFFITENIYYKESNSIKEEIDYNTYRINTFIDDYINLN